MLASNSFFGGQRPEDQIESKRRPKKKGSKEKKPGNRKMKPKEAWKGNLKGKKQWRCWRRKHERNRRPSPKMYKNRAPPDQKINMSSLQWFIWGPTQVWRHVFWKLWGINCQEKDSIGKSCQDDPSQGVLYGEMWDLELEKKHHLYTLGSRKFQSPCCHHPEFCLRLSACNWRRSNFEALVVPSTRTCV